MLDARMHVPLGQLALAAEMVLAIAVALLVLALIRHDARPYLRLFVAAWLLHAAGLAAWLGFLGSGRAVLQVLSLYLGFGRMACSLFRPPSPTRRDARRPGSRSGRSSRPSPGPTALPALLQQVPLVCRRAGRPRGRALGAAAAVLWPLREPASSGLQAVAGSLACLAVVGFARAGSWVSADLQPAARWNDVLSLVSLLLIASFGFGLALSLAEAAQWALTATGRQLQEARDRLSVIARTDALTGCFNRQVFRELVDDLRAGGRQAGSVVVAELADVSRINAERGAAAGTKRFERPPTCSETTPRATDLLIRWGSDQFVAVLPGVTIAAAELDDWRASPRPSRRKGDAWASPPPRTDPDRRPRRGPLRRARRPTRTSLAAGRSQTRRAVKAARPCAVFRVPEGLSVRADGTWHVGEYPSLTSAACATSKRTSSSKRTGRSSWTARTASLWRSRVRPSRCSHLDVDHGKAEIRVALDDGSEELLTEGALGMDPVTGRLECRVRGGSRAQPSREARTRRFSSWPRKRAAASSSASPGGVCRSPREAVRQSRDPSSAPTCPSLAGSAWPRPTASRSEPRRSRSSRGISASGRRSP